MKFVQKVSDFENIIYGESFSYRCKKCGKIATISSFRRFRIPTYSNFLCTECGKNEHTNYKIAVRNRENTCLKKYGITSPMKLDKVKEEIKHIFLKKYGVTNPMKNLKIKKKMKKTWKNKSSEEIKNIVLNRENTCLKKYGVTSPMQLDGVKEKSRITYKNRTGYDYNSQNPNVIKKIKKTWKNKSSEEIKNIVDKRKEAKKQHYGNPNFVNLEKIRQTKLERYGNPNFVNLEKIKKTKLDRYGFEFYTNREKAKSTCVDLYGTPYPMMISKVKEKSMTNKLEKYHNLSGDNGGYYYFGVNFNSSWELALWIYFTDFNIPIKRESKILLYTDMYNVTKRFIVDFEINGLLVEVKGDQYWDDNGMMIYPYNTEFINGKWTKLTPERRIYRNDIAERKHQCGLKNGVVFLKYDDCKQYLDYCDLYHPGWKELYKKENIFNPSYWYTCMYYKNLIGKYFYSGYSQLYNFGTGITPFDINKTNEIKSENNDVIYVKNDNTGVTPFDFI